MLCTSERPEDPEVTAAGAAIAAGLGCGFWSSQDHVKVSLPIFHLMVTHQKLLSRGSTSWIPTLPEEDRKNKIKLWNKAVERSLNWV